MFLFSLGTVPLMLGIGLIGGKLNQKYARPMRIASALLVVLMGMSMLASGLALAGVGVAASPMGEDGFAVIQGDAQYVQSEIDYGSYPVITVQAGVPVKWTIVADEGKLNGCNNEIVIPAYDLTVPLVAGDNLVEFTPTETGVFPYTCWMGMIRSSIYVVDSLEGASVDSRASAIAEEALTDSASSAGSCCDPEIASTYNTGGSCCDPVVSSTYSTGGSCCDPEIASTYSTGGSCCDPVVPSTYSIGGSCCDPAVPSTYSASGSCCN